MVLHQRMNVRCTVCGREENPAASAAVTTGWPKCCGYTMRLESTKEFIAQTEAIMAAKVDMLRGH